MRSAEEEHSKRIDYTVCFFQISMYLLFLNFVAMLFLKVQYPGTFSQALSFSVAFIPLYVLVFLATALLIFLIRQNEMASYILIYILAMVLFLSACCLEMGLAFLADFLDNSSSRPSALTFVVPFSAALLLLFIGYLLSYPLIFQYQPRLGYTLPVVNVALLVFLVHLGLELDRGKLTPTPFFFSATVGMITLSLGLSFPDETGQDLVVWNPYYFSTELVLNVFVVAESLLIASKLWQTWALQNNWPIFGLLFSVALVMLKNVL